MMQPLLRCWDSAFWLPGLWPLDFDRLLLAAAGC
jgi:hypothetical protein